MRTVGLIVGLVVGGTALALIFAAGIFMYVMKRRGHAYNLSHFTLGKGSQPRANMASLDSINAQNVESRLSKQYTTSPGNNDTMKGQNAPNGSDSDSNKSHESTEQQNVPLLQHTQPNLQVVSPYKVQPLPENRRVQTSPPVGKRSRTPSPNKQRVPKRSPEYDGAGSESSIQIRPNMWASATIDVDQDYDMNRHAHRDLPTRAGTKIVHVDVAHVVDRSGQMVNKSGQMIEKSGQMVQTNGQTLMGGRGDEGTLIPRVRREDVQVRACLCVCVCMCVCVCACISL